MLIRSFKLEKNPANTDKCHYSSPCGFSQGDKGFLCRIQTGNLPSIGESSEGKMRMKWIGLFSVCPENREARIKERRNRAGWFPRG